jgi:two-component system phosphate regulon sensor histidine kinase PhoR
MKPWIARFWPSLTGLALLALSIAVSPTGYGTQPGLWLVRTGFLLTGFLLGSSLIGLVLQSVRRDERLVRRYFNDLLLAQDRTQNHRLPEEVPLGPWTDTCRRVSGQLADLRLQLVELEAVRASTELRARRQEARADQAGAILSALPEPVIAIDGYDELLLANASAAELFDLRLESGEHRALARLLHCEKLVSLLTETRRRKAPGCRTGEIEVSDASGEAHAYSVTARMLTARSGAPAENGAGAVAVLRDISGQRALQKRNAEFVSAVSHEMKTPLAGIKAYVELLADGDADDKKTEQEFLHVINSQADRLQRLIDNLLNLSRIEAGVVSVEKQSRPLNELLEEAFRVVQPLADSKQIHLIKDMSPMYLGVFADRDMLLQAAINLLSNAVKYTPKGGQVTLRSRMVDNDVQFEVEDNGVGLSPEDCAKVFEKFYRVRKDKDMATGTGLGLPLAKHIVEDVHGGKLWVESAPGRGSTFSIRLPGAARLT